MAAVLLIVLVLGFFYLLDRPKNRQNKINRYNKYTHCIWCGRLYQVKNGSEHFCSLKCEKEHR